MNKTLETFFELIRSGLWGTEPNMEMFSSKVDWPSIYQYSKTQALLGIVLDGINILPENLRPPRLLYLKWCAEVLQIEDDNRKLDSEVINLFKLLRGHGIEPILMKGQGIGRNYPNPLHRSSGDIDIFIGKNNFEKVNDLLLREGESNGLWNEKHDHIDWHDVTVENHWEIARMVYPKADKKLQKIVNDWHLSEKSDKVFINDYKISVPPIDFDVVFILLHTVNHLSVGGVGLRQVCDWALLLHNRQKEINKAETKRILKDLDLINASKIFGALAVKYLGLPVEDLIIPFSREDEKESLQLLEDILDSGNFGCIGYKAKNKSKNWIKRKILNFGSALRRELLLRRILPGPTFWYAYNVMAVFFRANYNKLRARKS